MHYFSTRIKYVFLPLVLIGLGFIICYSFLHWLLVLKAGLPINESLISIWLPFTLPFLPVFLWLRPGLKLFQFKTENGSFGFQFLAAMAIAVPTIIAQEYLITATGKLTSMDKISEFPEHPTTKYYSLANYFVDKQQYAIQNTATVTGKNNNDLNMLIYVAIPLLNNASDTLQPTSGYWIGKKYSKRISNRMSREEKNERFDQFIDASHKEFDTTNFTDFTYLEIIENNDDYDEFSRALKNKNINISNTIFFKAYTTPFSERNGQKLPWLLGSFAIGLFVFFILLLIPKINTAQLQLLNRPETSSRKDLKELFDLLIPKEDYFITPILINCNMAIFIVMVMAGLGFASFRATDLLQWGANYRPSIIAGQWWRLLTSSFLHGGLMHLLANMYGLLFVGIFLEPLIGRKKFILIYLSTGILASIASVGWYPATVSIGASGAIFGLYGFFLACLLFKVVHPEIGKGLLFATLIFVGFNLFMGIAGGIDNAAHIGGLLSGFVIGMFMAKKLREETN